MSKTLSEKAQDIFDKANTTDMKIIFQLAKDTLLSKIDADQKELANKLNLLQADKESVTNNN